jgi:hypothetical protein
LCEKIDEARRWKSAGLMRFVPNLEYQRAAGTLSRKINVELIGR